VSDKAKLVSREQALGVKKRTYKKRLYKWLWWWVYKDLPRPFRLVARLGYHMVDWARHLEDRTSDLSAWLGRRW
jgi:hypothetical protein